MVAVEDTQRIIIPTRSKAKISHELSYPIGAERISSALAGVAQLPELVLHFRGDWYDRLRFGRYPYLRVVYSRTPKPVNPESASGVPLFNEWEIIVKPIRRSSRHKIQQHILGVALPQVEQWLQKRTALERPGSDILTLFYDEDSGTFSEEQETRLEPIRGRS